MKNNPPLFILIALLGITAVWYGSSAMSEQATQPSTKNQIISQDALIEKTIQHGQLGAQTLKTKAQQTTQAINDKVKEVSTNISTTEPTPAPPLVQAAREQIGVTLFYDPAYVKLDYPMGDVPKERGVCTDVVVRAYRDLKDVSDNKAKDLQALVNADMKQAWSQYPKNWGLKTTDSNIDHRRVPNLQVFFKRHGKSLEISDKASDYKAGDLVTWKVDGKLPHIGIVSNKTTSDGTPLIIHNIGRGTQEENILFDYPITGHYHY